jgi:hypothetical protein
MQGKVTGEYIDTETFQVTLLSGDVIEHIVGDDIRPVKDYVEGGVEGRMQACEPSQICHEAAEKLCIHEAMISAQKPSLPSSKSKSTTRNASRKLPNSCVNPASQQPKVAEDGFTAFHGSAAKDVEMDPVDSGHWVPGKVDLCN